MVEGAGFLGEECELTPDFVGEGLIRVSLSSSDESLESLRSLLTLMSAYASSVALLLWGTTFR